jgi:hypothetical protein
MGISETQKKMPRMSRALFEFGGPGRNRPGPRMKPPFLLEYVADSLGPKRQL